MTLTKVIGEYETARTWFDGLRRQWGEEPSDWDERLEALEAFCAFVEKEPDAMVSECLRDSASGKRISAKGRRFYNDKIAEWQASLPGDRAAQGRAGNAVRSFLIHNGIFLQSGMQT
jgi:hypothetical protein